jgi:hypothetical protein
MDTSMDQIKDAIDALYDDAHRDEQLRNWFKQAQPIRPQGPSPAGIRSRATVRQRRHARSARMAVASMTTNTRTISTTSSTYVHSLDSRLAHI